MLPPFILFVLTSVGTTAHRTGPASVPAHTTAPAIHSIAHTAPGNGGDRYQNASCWATFDELRGDMIYNQAYCTCNDGHSGAAANITQLGPYTACPSTMHIKQTSRTKTHSHATTKGTPRATSIVKTSSLGPPPCVMSQDPDSGEPRMCVCRNGATISPVKISGGSGCPWKHLPSNAVSGQATQGASASHTGPVTVTESVFGQYTFTQTLGSPGGSVVVCQSISYLGVPGTVVPQCAGSFAVIYTPPPQPSLIMTIGNDTSAFIGSLNGTDLMNSLTDALNAVCPTGDSTCSKDATISPITYPVPGGNNYGGISTGYLDISLDYVHYENDTMRDVLIAALAVGVNQTLFRPNACKNLTRVVQDGSIHVGPHSVDFWACFVTGLVYINYYSGSNLYGADDLMYARLSFQGVGDQSDVGMELCADCLTGIDVASVLLFWCVPCQPIIGAANKAVSAVCNAVSHIEEAASFATASTPLSLP